MDGNTRPASAGRRPIVGELIIPVAAILFTLYYFSTIVDSPWTAQVSAFFVGAVLIVLVLIIFGRSALAVRRGQATLRPRRTWPPSALAVRRLALMALTLGYVVLIEWGGFTLTTFAFLASAMLLLAGGRKAHLILPLAAAIALIGYGLFMVAFETRFPRGPFEQLMAAVL
jgi:hypothetical protein